MSQLIEWLSKINHMISSFTWGPIMQIVFLAVGLLFTIRTGFFQFTKFKFWIKKTILSFGSKDVTQKSDSKNSVSQFQTICTALAATIGTGNIVGVATAITAGGPGAIFWMWVSSLLGMMTTYAENVLGIRYRYRGEDGRWYGGPMAYMEHGLHSKAMAICFAILCIVASLGMGNMVQANSVSSALYDTFQIPSKITGIVLAGVIGAVMMGGISRIGKVTEKLVPFMAIVFMFGAISVILVNLKQLPMAFASIIGSAFSLKAGTGGVLGYGISVALRLGISRGIFTNEAGLGSSVVINQEADVKSAPEQGMWGIFAVFADTIVMCTLTALAILTSGVYDANIYIKALNTPEFARLPDGVVLTANAFEQVFGQWGSQFIAISIVFFAFATLLAWSYCGERTTEYVFGKKAIPIYQFIFIIAIFVGCISRLGIIWELSDTFNGLMAIPNLIAIVLLSKEVIWETDHYLKKK